jgi:hypothetical protein
MIMIMEAVSCTEMSVNIYQITQHNIPEDSHLFIWMTFNYHTPSKKVKTTRCVVKNIVDSFFSISAHVATITLETQYTTVIA